MSLMQIWTSHWDDRGSRQPEHYLGRKSHCLDLVN